MLISQFLGALVPNNKGLNFNSIVAKYNKFALLLPDTISILTNYIKNDPIPLPLLGFEYCYDSDIPFIVNEYSEYPYLNKQLLVEGAIKRNGEFSIKLLNIITNLNKWTTQQINNQIFVESIQEYVDRGGTFILTTPFGDLDNCVMTGIYGVVDEGTTTGITFRADLMKIPKVNQSTDEVMIGSISKFITGAIV